MSDDLNTLKINKDYQQKFHHLKKIQLLEKAKNKYGRNFENIPESSSDDESEDSQAVLVNDKVMEKFLDVFNKITDDNGAQELLKSKDPLFNDEDFKREVVPGSHDVGAKYTVQDALLDYKDDEAQDDFYNVNYKETTKKRTDREKEEFMKKAQEEDKEDGSESGSYLDDGFLKIKVKDGDDEDEVYDSQAQGVQAKDEKNLEDLELDEVLKKKKLNVGNDDLIKKFWGDSNDVKLDKNERFLRNYILSQAWLENNENCITKRLLLVDREDEDKESLYDEFEAKHNFRYEEEGGANITTHKRDLETYRQKDDSRKEKRKEKAERKKDEKQKIVSELEMAKEFKKSELKEKLEKIERVAGTEKIKEIADALEGEFDMAKFDEVMNKVFDDEYYGEKEGDDEIQQVIEEKEEEDQQANYNINNYEEEAGEGDYNEYNEDAGSEENEWFYCDECRDVIKENKIKYACEKCDYITCKECYKSITHKHTMKKDKVPLGCKVRFI
jgi:protein KRI1